MLPTIAAISACPGANPNAVPKGTPPRSSMMGAMETIMVKNISPRSLDVNHSNNSKLKHLATSVSVLYHSARKKTI